jgi:hypothetical protein
MENFKKKWKKICHLCNKSKRNKTTECVIIHVRSLLQLTRTLYPWFSFCSFGTYGPQMITKTTMSIIVHLILQKLSGADPGFVVRGGAWVCEGSGDRLRPQRVQDRALVGDQGGEAPRKLWGLRNYRRLFERQFWTNHTVFIRPKKLDFES